MDLLKEYFKKNQIFEIERGSCFHVIELTNNYVTLKSCVFKHEIKYYFDKDEHSDLMFCDALHRLKSDDKSNQGIGINFEFSVFKSDVFGKEKTKQTLKEKIDIIDDVIKEMSLKQALIEFEKDKK